MPEQLTLRQAGAQLELRLDRCHWQAIELLREKGPIYYASDVERERTRLEDLVLRTADDRELDGLILDYSTTGTLFGSGRRLLNRMVSVQRTRRGK